MHSANPSVSFVVPSYRSRETILGTLDSISRQDFSEPYEVIVVDSTGDGTASWLRTRYPHWTIVELDRRTWPGPARNRGAQCSRGDYLAFVDADAVLQTNWLTAMTKTLMSVAEAGFVGGWVRLGEPASVWGRILHWIEFSGSLPGLPSGFRDSLSSSNWLIPRESFISAQGFPEDFAMSEDLIFCHVSGLRAYFTESSGIVHRSRKSFASVREHLRLLGFWSGRFRCLFPVKGSRLSNFPLLSFALPIYRGWKVLGRIFRAESADALRALLYLPLILAGLWMWAAGFRDGVRGFPERSPDSQQGH